MATELNPTSLDNRQDMLQADGLALPVPTILMSADFSSTGTGLRRDATEEEIKTLRHVVDRIPRTVWIALMIGAVERFTYYCITPPWRKCLIFSIRTCRALISS